MKLALEIKNSNEIATQDKAEIDEFIQNVIEVHKGNSAAINRLVMDSITALTVSEARTSELQNQGVFKRLWGGLAGNNQNNIADIDRNLAKSQYASHQMIQKLAEQNLLAFDTITAVNNKLNTLMVEVDEELNKIYKTLVVFFKQTRADIIQMGGRIDRLERNIDLLHWNSTIEYQMYDGVDYCELPDIEKIVCVSNDFYHLTKGNWSTPDIMIMKSTLSEIGLPVKSKISSKDFYKYLADKPKLIDRLFKDLSLDGLTNLEEFQAPLLKGVEKLSKLQGEEKYLLDTLTAQLESLGVDYNKRDLQISMIHHYLVNTAFMRTDAEVTMFDFVVELLTNISMINISFVQEEIALGLTYEKKSQEENLEGLNNVKNIELRNMSRKELEVRIRKTREHKFFICNICGKKVKAANLIKHYDYHVLQREINI